MNSPLDNYPTFLEMTLWFAIFSNCSFALSHVVVIPTSSACQFLFPGLGSLTSFYECDHPQDDNYVDHSELLVCLSLRLTQVIPLKNFCNTASL